MGKIAILQTFSLYLFDKTIKLHNVRIIKTNNSIHLVCNPLAIKLERWEGLGICAFDDDGIIGCVRKLPRFMYKMLTKQKLDNHSEEAVEDN